jgi:hypothetical protein
MIVAGADVSVDFRESIVPQGTIEAAIGKMDRDKNTPRRNSVAASRGDKTSVEPFRVCRGGIGDSDLKLRMTPEPLNLRER